MATVERSADPSEIRSFTVEIPEAEVEALRARIAATRWPSKELVPDRSQGVQLATTRALADYWANEYDFGRVEARLNALPQFTTRDRRGGHPLHPRAVAARGRAAADHDARLARLGHRAARDRRPADRPDRARWAGRGRVPPRAAVPARLRLLRRAGRARLERRPRRAGLGGADAPPRLRPLCRPGRRRGRPRHRRDGTPGPRGAARHPREPARDGAGRPPAGGIRAGTRGGGPGRHVQGGRLRLLPGDGHPAADDRLRPAGFTASPWPPGCSTTTRTATTRSPAPSSTASPRAISPGTRSSTTSRCTG